MAVTVVTLLLLTGVAPATAQEERGWTLAATTSALHVDDALADVECDPLLPVQSLDVCARGVDPAQSRLVGMDSRMQSLQPAPWSIVVVAIEAALDLCRHRLPVLYEDIE